MMSAMAYGMLILLSFTAAFAAAIHEFLRRYWALSCGRVTRLFAVLMLIHAVANLLQVANQPPGAEGARFLAYGGAAVFTLVYACAAWRNTDRLIRVAIALPLGSFIAVLVLTGVGQFPFAPHLLAYDTAIAALACATAWWAHRKRRDAGTPKAVLNGNLGAR